MSKELLRQSLYALEIDGIQPDLQAQIRVELAKPEPEPVAIFTGKRIEPAGTREFFGNLLVDDLKSGSKLYTSQPQQKPLSDDEIIQIGYRAGFAIDTLENEETGEDDCGFLNEEGDVDNEVFF